ncbi:MAG TPA: GNAT family N-acetyltransferase [Lachnospiraceae bacterium]|nr:GNAT family N-acetyltransferase [Lachnospiraceae bacterium]
MSTILLKTIILLFIKIENEEATLENEEIPPRNAGTEDMDSFILQLKSCNIHTMKAFDFSEEKYSLDETLIITDCSTLARKYMKKGYPVIGYRHGFNIDDLFSKVTYVVENLQEITADYFVNIFKRFKKLPWEILETRRCRVREITVDDTEALYKIYKDPSITLYMENLFGNPLEEKEYIKNYISSIYGFYGFGMWIIELKETGEIIGRGGLEQKEDSKHLELGYVIAKPYQRQGYGKEVCSAILQYGYESLGETIIEAIMEEENQASLALCSSLGFQFHSKVIKDFKNYKRFTITILR